jgi:hypothetical protein
MAYNYYVIYKLALASVCSEALSDISYVVLHIYETCSLIYLQGVPGGMCQTSEGCSLC